MSSESFRAEVGDRSFEFVWDGTTLSRDGRPIDLEVIPIGDEQYAVRLDGVNHTISFEDRQENEFTVRRLDGARRVRVLGQRDLLLQRLGLESGDSARDVEVRAPMPGLVLKVLVAPGDQVEKGASLVVLEAMKMENEIRATNGGVVASVGVKAGDAVVKNALLLEFRP